LLQVLPSFSKQLIDYTEKTFNDEKISVRTKTMVKKVTDKTIEAEITGPDGSKTTEVLPYGLLVWATGNAVRPVVKDLMAQLPAQKDSRRGLAVDDHLMVKGTENVWAIGDCAVAGYAPTAQVAGQEGNYLARYFNALGRSESLQQEIQSLEAAKARATADAERERIDASLARLGRQLRRVKPVGAFKYTHQGSLAYIGSEKAVADLNWFSGNFSSGGGLTYLFWRSAYLSMCFSGESCLSLARGRRQARNANFVSIYSPQSCTGLS
jgi:NADH:ubiquinone reductase (non-electrogenic)